MSDGCKSKHNINTKPPAVETICRGRFLHLSIPPSLFTIKNKPPIWAAYGDGVRFYFWLRSSRLMAAFTAIGSSALRAKNVPPGHFLYALSIPPHLLSPLKINRPYGRLMEMGYVLYMGCVHLA